MLKRPSLKTLVLGLVLVIVAALGIFWLNTARISVTTESDGVIYAKQGEGDFREIGSGRAVFKTSGRDTVFIEVRKGEAVTQKAVYPKKARNVRVQIDLKVPSRAQSIAPGPVSYPLVENGFIYGINPRTSSLTVRPLDGNGNSPPVIPQLPFLKEIVWNNSRNFFFVSRGRGAGTVSEGRQVDSYNFVEVATTGSGDLVLLESGGLYVAPGGSVGTVKKIAPHISNSSPFLYADDDHIFFGGLTTDEEAEEGGEPVFKNMILKIYDGNYEETRSLTLPIKDEIFNIFTVDEKRTAILTTAGLFFLSLDDGELAPVEFSFGRVEDIILYKGRLLLLGSAGLWEYSPEEAAYYKLASYPSGEDYVPSSLAQTGNDIYFSTTISREELDKESTTAQNRVLKISLD